MRDPHTQVCPAAMNAANAAPLTARSISMSSKRMTAPLPPSSSVAAAKLRAAAAPIERPTSVLPVKVTFRIFGWEASAAPDSAPTPLTTLTTPLGMPARSRSSTSRLVVSGVCSEGLMTTLLPVASAGARLFDKDHQRMIEGRHERDDAERHALRVAQVRPFDWDDVTAARKGQRREIAIELRKARDLRPRLDNRAAVVQRLELVERFQIGLEQIGEAVEHAGALLGRRPAPFSFVEGALRGCDGAVHVDCAGIGEPPDHGACGRVDDVQRLAARGIGELAVDEELRVVGDGQDGHGFRTSAGKGATTGSASISSRRRFFGSTPSVRTTNNFHDEKRDHENENAANPVRPEKRDDDEGRKYDRAAPERIANSRRAQPHFRRKKLRDVDRKKQRHEDVDRDDQRKARHHQNSGIRG